MLSASGSGFWITNNKIVICWLMGSQLACRPFLETNQEQGHVPESWKILSRKIPLEDILFIHVTNRRKQIQVIVTINSNIFMRSSVFSFLLTSLGGRTTFFILPLAKKPIWAFQLYFTAKFNGSYWQLSTYFAQAKTSAYVKKL